MALTREDFVHPSGHVGQPFPAAALNLGAAPADVADLPQLSHAPRPIDVAFEQLGLKARAEIATCRWPLVVLDVQFFNALAEDWHPLVRRRIPHRVADIEMRPDDLRAA